MPVPWRSPRKWAVLRVRVPNTCLGWERRARREGGSQHATGRNPGKTYDCDSRHKLEVASSQQVLREAAQAQGSNLDGRLAVGGRPRLDFRDDGRPVELDHGEGGVCAQHAQRVAKQLRAGAGQLRKEGQAEEGQRSNRDRLVQRHQRVGHALLQSEGVGHRGRGELALAVPGLSGHGDEL